MLDFLEENGAFAARPHAGAFQSESRFRMKDVSASPRYAARVSISCRPWSVWMAAVGGTTSTA
jgi:hypothetical protein